MYSVLNTAISGLNTAQRAMDVIGQNVTNANTEGYSRQQVRVSTVGSSNTATFHTGQKVVLGGATVDAIARVHDAFLENARASAGSRLSALTAEAGALDGVQQLMKEPTDTGLQKSLTSFYSAFATLASNPNQSAAGQVAISSGVQLATDIKTMAVGVQDNWNETRNNLDDTVRQVNDTSSELAKVNEGIRIGTVSGNSVNDLLDQRDTLVRKLGSLVGATARPGPNNTVQVAVNGITIVADSIAEKLTLSGSRTIGGVTSDPPRLMWGSTTVPVDSGEAAGMLAAITTDMPNVMSQLDGIATSLHDAVNTIHTSGFTLAGAAGGDFFSYTGAPGASTIAVAVTSPTDLAVASATGTTAGENAAKIADLAIDANAKLVLGADGPSAKWRSLVGAVAASVASLDSAINVQNSVVNAADDSVASDSGVNLDEEMTNMMLWQRSYQASARVITVADTMMDTLINMAR